MGIKEDQPRKILYGLVALTLILCIALSAVAYLKTPAVPSAEQTSNKLPEQSALNQANNDNSTNSSTATNPQNTSVTTTSQNNSSLPVDDQPSQNATTTQEPQNSSLLSEEEALNLAMPYIQAYASENNRTIASLNATFYAQIRDLGGLRGNVSQFYPAWWVVADFVRVDDIKNPEHWIIGYSVSIWADTAEVYSAHVQGIM